MPTVTTNPPTQPQAEQPEQPHPLVALVDKVVSAKTESSSPSGGGGSSIVVYILLIGVAVIGISIVGWLLVRARRRAAQLAYELRKKEEEQAQAAENLKLADNEKARSEAAAKVDELNEGIQQLKGKLEAERVLQETRSKALQDATSWKDLGL